MRTKSGDGRLNRDLGVVEVGKVMRAGHEPRWGRRRAELGRSRVLGGEAE